MYRYSYIRRFSCYSRSTSTLLTTPLRAFRTNGWLRMPPRKSSPWQNKLSAILLGDWKVVSDPDDAQAAAQLNTFIITNHKDALARCDRFILTHSSNKNHYIIDFCYESLSLSLLNVRTRPVLIFVFLYNVSEGHLGALSHTNILRTKF
jgi:hypothetical protein